MKKFVLYTFCASLTLGIIHDMFAAQTSYAKDDNGNHYGQIKNATNGNSGNNGNHYGQIKNGNNGNHYGQVNQVNQAESAPAEASPEPTEVKLEGEKLTFCQKKESTLKTHMQRAIDQGENQLNVFKTIENRTKIFYLAQGHTVSTYETASSEADDKYAIAKEIVDNLSTQTFTCSDNNPKQILTTFHDAVTAKNQALNDYRTAVKNLIVAVKSAQSQSTPVEAR